MKTGGGKTRVITRKLNTVIKNPSSMQSMGLKNNVALTHIGDRSVKPLSKKCKTRKKSQLISKGGGGDRTDNLDSQEAGRENTTVFSANADITAVDTTLAGFTSRMKEPSEINMGMDMSVMQAKSDLIDPYMTTKDFETQSNRPDKTSPTNLILEQK